MASYPLCPAAALVAALAFAAANAQTPPPASPAAPAPAGPELVPLDHFALPDGLELTVWAKAPQLRNPTNMDIDARGRIWVTEGVNYRRHLNRDQAGDRVVVLEDTDGDGTADSSHVFVQEPLLVAPLGIAVLDNKIIVSNAPDLIVYTDVDRNARFDPAVDKREVLLTGFNGANHDHSLHSVTFGPDGWWYLNQGNSGALFTDRSGRTFRVGSTYDPIRSGGATPVFGWRPPDISGVKSDDGHAYVGGFAFRMRPDGTNVQVLGHGFRNSYEQTVTSFGDIFQNDNDDTPACRTAFLLEHGNAGFFSRDGHRTWQADRRPGQTVPVAQWRQDDPGVIPSGDVYGAGAPTGIVFNEGDGLGAEWRGLLISAEAARNTLFGYKPEADGAGYKLERLSFLTSNKAQVLAGIDSLRGRTSTELGTFFRPADVAIGPDGALYVADWFDPRVGGHADHDDKVAGAIYRIAPKGFKPVVPQLDLATTEGLLAALKSPAVNVRALGYVGLREKGAAAIPAVSALLDDENPFIRARAVWLLADLGPAGLAKVEGLLRHDDPRFRAAAFRALRRHGHRALEHAAALAEDASPAVRREVALSLRDVPFASARDLLLKLARGYDGQDRTYLEAWGIGCTGKEADVYAALAAANPERDALRWSAAHAGLAWRLTPPDAAADFAKRAAATALPERDRLAAVTALGFMPTRAAAMALVELAHGGTGAVRNHAFWWLLNYRASRWADLGIDAELKARGLYDPAKQEITASVVPSPLTETPPPIDSILQLAGDAKRGEGLVAACYLCHKVGANGVDYGPDLTAFAKLQTPAVVAQAIVNPSAEIAHGYEGTEVKLKDGTVVHGLVLSTGDPLVVQSMGGVVQLIPSDRVESRRRLDRSLMMSAGQLGLGPQEVADILAYLRGL
ncbi:MAG TPA: PVC-type heme-binding CxxCH protein [Opitutaceae bacterium]|nr:PVC-type heme-binding CxxCH protein [Opitutaceae bacterium]